MALSAPALADQIQLTGVARDFKRGDKTGGHPDFETASAANKLGQVLNMVTMTLGADGKPVYNPTRPSSKDTMSSKASFDQWYRDVIGVNVSQPLTLTLDNEQSAPGGVYTYQSNSFFPLDNKLFGNQSLSHNYHFTFELHTNFTYSPNQNFTFIGDDDVWVYVNGKRCIDIGGVHTAVTGSFRLFDGKAWVTKAHFVVGGDVKKLSSAAEVTALQARWTNLGLPGVCPIVLNDLYIDLNLNSGFGDTRAVFNNTSVTVYAAQAIDSVVLTFNTGHTQTFSPGGTNATLTGSGINLGRPISRVVIYAGGNPTGQAHSSNGATSIDCSLGFFFAERQTTQSNFRIDTSILLNTVQPTTISPLYD
jgi:fibro-slime domain-containing protein